MLGIDYAWQHPNPAAIKAAGYDFVLRYLSQDPSKDLTAGEAQALHAAGLSVGVIWEQAAQAALNGAAQGTADAAQANSQADTVGYPAGCPIFFAVDFDVQPGQMPAVVAYFQSAKANSERPIGAYGSGALVAGVQGECDYLFQAEAWSGSVVEPAADLYQRVTPTLPAITGAAGAYDEDVLLKPVPLWTPSGAPPTPTPAAPPPFVPTTTTIGDTVQRTTTQVQIAAGQGWCYNPVPAGNLVSVLVMDEAPAVVGGYDDIPAFAGLATDQNNPDGILVFRGGADGVYGVTVIST